MKSSNIGGQAVLEGIMMKNGKDYAVAVRKPDKEIEVKKDEYRSFIKWEKLTKIPFIRGIFNFIDSMVLGMKTLTYSASFYEEEETSRVLTEEEAKKQEKKENVLMGITVAVSIVLAMGIFMVLPYFISGLFDKVQIYKVCHRRFDQNCYFYRLYLAHFSDEGYTEGFYVPRCRA